MRSPESARETGEQPVRIQWACNARCIPCCCCCFRYDYESLSKNIPYYVSASYLYWRISLSIMADMKRAATHTRRWQRRLAVGCWRRRKMSEYERYELCIGLVHKQTLTLTHIYTHTCTLAEIWVGRRRTVYISPRLVVGLWVRRSPFAVFCFLTGAQGGDWLWLWRRLFFFLYLFFFFAALASNFFFPLL